MPLKHQSVLMAKAVSAGIAQNASPALIAALKRGTKQLRNAVVAHVLRIPLREGFSILTFVFVLYIIILRSDSSGSRAPA